ncbi:helix-turn-helix transcriptional regulator [Geodermatophilus normandii]|uniref:Helix-turn-helix domain-containing protein n=1 Tax=Geodermatophilus normandii TaxID=1137989 RepID=A0A6P0GG02_9ACTN|nr:helix-turn-helix transcriptional regulator [Geodermatophilus normandii]NEM06184.1 helix-turn-helix domain-containing protein [Geodermatophilus normandii]
MARQRAPAFRDRSRERAALDRLVQDARDGRSAVLVLRGEAGVGKTALLRHTARRATGFRVAEIAGVEAEMELPFAGLHQLCAPMLDRLDALPGHQQSALGVALGLAAGEAPDRFLVALAALGLLSSAAEEAPLLCLVDDVQWLDRATGQVLGFVARRLLAEPVALVLAVREPHPEPELTGLPELRLEGLGDDDARALLAGVVPGPLDERVRDRIVAETRGNPLALLELPRGRSTAELGGGFAVPGAGGLPRRLEESYVRRLDALPEDTRRLVLLAAADPVGDATLLWRAARTLGIGAGSAAAAAEDGLLEIGGRVRFRHPLVRSAVYRAASEADRRAAHAALEAATDPEADPDRRAWHRAHAATAPDDDVAAELVERAARAQARGGIAATAAFLECACALTGDPALQAGRALAAARAKFAAGDADAAESLLATAESGPLDELSRAEVGHLRGQIAFDLRRGRDAPRKLLGAARRLERLDADLARETHLEALVAAVYAARLAEDGDVLDVAVAARSAPLDEGSPPPAQLLLTGLATRLTDGSAAAAPALAAALRAHRAEEPRLDWLSVPFVLAAQDLLDGDAWLELASRQAGLARATGTLSLLPYALDYLAGHRVHAGELSAAEGLLAEGEGLAPRSRAETLPYIPLQLAAWRGEAATVVQLAQAMTAAALARGEGCALPVVDYARAVLHNGAGEYDLALEHAARACAGDEVATSAWAAAELVEAAARVGDRQVAAAAAERLAARARAGGTPWARGSAARARALVTEGEAAGELHRGAVTELGRSGMAAHLARARLTHGEWLRRAGHRLEAREELRAAYTAFEAMGAAGFAERARHELLVTGERVRRRRDETRTELTPQELHIARLACDGRTNPEIGAMLFLSARTVEWHLRKVFEKLGITSRRGLQGALAGRDTGGPAGGAPATRTA